MILCHISLRFSPVGYEICISSKYLAFCKHFAYLVCLQKIALFGKKYIKGYLGSKCMVGKGFDIVKGKPAEGQSKVCKLYLFD